MKTSDFVLAFVPVFLTSIDTLKRLGADKQDIDKFTYKCAPKHLVSFGCALSKNGKLKDDYIQKAVKSSTMLQLKEEFPDIDLYIDSGGYQCGQGYIPKHEIPKFADVYKEFLKQYQDNYTWAFALDVPPNDSIFISWDEIRHVNFQTYELAQDLDPSIRQKLIFVFHFRSPRIWHLWSEVLANFASFYGPYWSVGGVAGFNVNNRMPCWLYSLPITLFLKYHYGRDETLRFHILGDFSWTTIFFTQLVHHAIKAIHNLDVRFTYDATSIVTGNLKYRYLWDFDTKTGFVDKVLIRKTDKHKKRSKDETNLDAALRLLAEFAEVNNFPILEVTDVDRENSDSFLSDVASYVVLQTIYQYHQVESYCDRISQQLIQLYVDGKLDEFNKEVMHVLQQLHSGRLSYTIERRKAYASTTLSIIEDLSSERVEHLLNMLSDEFRFTDEIPRW